MVKKFERRIITGLDIGTSKVVALVGEVTPEGTLKLIGLGRYPSRGLKRGVVVDIEATVSSIQHAVQEAELMAGCEVRSVYAGIAGSHIRSINSHGIVAIRDSEVSSADIERVIDAAKAVAIPADQKILHILPQEFIIDHQGNIREPVGMAGVRLEARVHLVTGSASAAQNIAKCIRRCGLEVSDIILEQLASSHAILTEDEKELGVCLVDIGGGTTDIAIFHDGAIQHTAVIPIAGDQVTNDIAVALRTPSKSAEAIKLSYGSTLTEGNHANQTIEIASAQDKPGRKIPNKMLSDVVGARYEELFDLVRAEVQRSGFADLMAAGIVLTGGASCVNGAIDLAEMCFQVPVRHGFSHQNVMTLPEAVADPSLATAVGLLLQGYKQEFDNGFVPRASNGSEAGVWTRMRKWLNVNF